MKHKCSITLILSIMVLMALPSKLCAQQIYQFSDRKGVYLVEYIPNGEESETENVIRSNYAGFGEVRLGMGYNPYTPMGFTSIADWIDYPVNLPLGTTLSNATWFNTNIDAGSWLKRWLYIGGVASWTTGSSRVSSIVDHSRVDAFSYNNITIMPIIRFAWVNRDIIQLYSGVGVGATYEFYENTLTTEIQKFHAAYDVTFIGITVGRKWFGYIDIGAGNRGVISCGLGYRFDNK